MAKILLEICLISARGLPNKSSFFKLQRYAVGWIDPKNKYCTKIDSSNNPNPRWETKFSTVIDTSDKEQDLNDLVLNVEVYSRDPIFLREKLLGTATVNLKEFLQKYLKGSETVKAVEEKGSFQLRRKKKKKKCNEAQGFVDLSIRVSEEREEKTSYSGENEGIVLMNHSNNNINLNKEYGAHQTLPPQQMEIHPQEASHYGRIRPVLRARDHSNIPTSGPTYASQQSYGIGGGTSYPPPPLAPPPPSLPLNGGYMPNFYLRTGNVGPSYINLPSSSGSAPRHGNRPGFGMGLGGGALAAGAMIFGDDFISGFDVDAARGLQDASFTISTDTPF